jgi:hypothetical protein
MKAYLITLLKVNMTGTIILVRQRKGISCCRNMEVKLPLEA